MKTFFCSLHPNQNITAICLAKDCPRRALCPMCFHKLQSHAKYVVPMESLNMKSISSKIEQTKKQEQENFNLVTQFEVEIDQVCDKMIDVCLELINTQRRLMKKRLLDTNPIYEHPQNWERFLSDIQNMLDHIQKPDSTVHDLHDYGTAVSHAEHKIRSERAKNEKKHGKLLLYHDEINALLQQIQNTIENLGSSLGQSFEMERLITDFSENLNLKKKLDTRGQTCGHSIDVLLNHNAIAIGDSNGYINLYSDTTFKQLSRKKAHSSWITNVKWSRPLDILFSAGADNLLKVFKVMKGGYSISLLKQFKENSPIYTLEPLDDRGTIVTGGKDPIIKVWCMKTLKTLGQIDTSPYYGVGFEMFLISKYDLIAVGFYNGAVILYDYRTLREFARVSKGIGENDHINTMAFIESKDLLCASVTDHVKFWKLNYEKKQFYEYKSLKYPEGRDGMAMIPFNSGKGLMCTNGSQKLFSINLSDWKFSELLSLDEPIGYVRINKRKRLMVVGLFADKVMIYNY